MAKDCLDKYLCRLKSGDESALQTIYEQTKKGVFSFVYSYLKNYHDAEDAMQTIYIKIKSGISGYQRSTNARGWILQIAKNHALNLVKKKQKEISTDQLPERAFEDYRLSGSITETMQKVLSEEEYRIVILHVLWGYKHKEIGSIIESPTGTITSKYKRAVEKIKRALKEEQI